jgi:hypothetical protein
MAAADQPSPLGMLVPMGMIFLIFYFLLIRPQQKRQRDLDAMIKAIDKNDRRDRGRPARQGGRHRRRRAHGRDRGAQERACAREDLAREGGVGDEGQEGRGS